MAEVGESSNYWEGEKLGSGGGGMLVFCSYLESDRGHLNAGARETGYEEEEEESGKGIVICGELPC